MTQQPKETCQRTSIYSKYGFLELKLNKQYCHINRPEIIGELPQERHLSIPAVVSGRFFDDTTCIPENKIEYEQSFPSCLNAYMKAGFISPKDSNPVKVLKPTGNAIDCEFENLFKQTAKCPKVGWTWSERITTKF